MSRQVNVTKIEVKNPQDSFLAPIKLNIFFEVKEELVEGKPPRLTLELEWKIVYVGSAENSAFDQVLEQFIMNKLSKGDMTFEISINHPDPTKIPASELTGASVIMVCAFYRNQEFFRFEFFP